MDDVLTTFLRWKGAPQDSRNSKGAARSPTKTGRVTELQIQQLDAGLNATFN